MLYPAMAKLLKNIDSRYLMVNVIAHRAAVYRYVFDLFGVDHAVQFPFGAFEKNQKTGNLDAAARASGARPHKHHQKKDDFGKDGP